ncbi:MAG: family 78 glycoside hydrolase catalytic domain, partial [Firmicutes bacterium]|nr:family 78 glycoside hydrolase catalytic domain [Bacillota bacterium]
QGWQYSPYQAELHKKNMGLLAQLEGNSEDGSAEVIATDDTWLCEESQVRFSEIYDGETYDASYVSADKEAVEIYEEDMSVLIAQEGEDVREMDRISARNIFVTPAGETVVDFGQNLTGYVEIQLTAKAGDRVELSHAEVMDQQGNFYTENYRSAKAKYIYTCKDGQQSYKPKLTFFGFRYIRVDQFPGEVKPENFTAVVVHSNMKRTGYLRSSNPLLNQLFDNIIWGQKGNFVDVPTDCPQRDERLGWTGDAEIFIRTACMNYDAEKFFAKWLADMEADQLPDGGIPMVVPNVMGDEESGAAWGDAAAVCPWELYMAYGNKDLLKKQFNMMKMWVNHITTVTEEPYLWVGSRHFGDWVGLDAPYGSYKGSSREELIASAYYGLSTSLVVKAGEVLGEDVSEYKELLENIIKAFRTKYTEYKTQTECIVAAHWGMAEDVQKTADQLAAMVKKDGQMMTGFVGTPYLLHVLSANGYYDLAYELLLRTEYPSWLYPVTKDATTIWEHWDGTKPDGTFWSRDMNSYNHYAYGSVADWVYQVAAGISPVEAGYKTAKVAPHPSDQLEYLEAEVETRQGRIISRWKKKDDMWQYDITTPVKTLIEIDGKSEWVEAGNYRYYSR